MRNEPRSTRTADEAAALSRTGKADSNGPEFGDPKFADDPSDGNPDGPRFGGDPTGRRLFLRHSALAAAGLVALPAVLLGCSGGREVVPAREASPGASGPEAGGWRARITAEAEPGEALLVSGTIYAADGRTPLEGATLYVYHTDARGLYSDTNGDPRETARLRARMLTGRDGRYEFRTIKPASYPGGTIPAHVHVSLKGPQLPERWLADYWFDDDPLLPRRDRERHANAGAFSPVLKLTRDAGGLLRGRRDIRVAVGG